MYLFIRSTFYFWFFIDTQKRILYDIDSTRKHFASILHLINHIYCNYYNDKKVQEKCTNEEKNKLKQADFTCLYKLIGNCSSTKHQYFGNQCFFYALNTAVSFLNLFKQGKLDNYIENINKNSVHEEDYTLTRGNKIFSSKLLPPFTKLSIQKSSVFEEFNNTNSMQIYLRDIHRCI